VLRFDFTASDRARASSPIPRSRPTSPIWSAAADHLAQHSAGAGTLDRPQPWRRCACWRRLRRSLKAEGRGGRSPRPSDPGHVIHLFKDKLDAIGEQGEVEVAARRRNVSDHVAASSWDDVAEHKLTEHVARLRKALLIFHSPTDDTVGIDQRVAYLPAAAKHPRAFVSLAGADHLLS